MVSLHFIFHGSRGNSTVDQCWVNCNALDEVENFRIGDILGALSDHSECILHLGSCIQDTQIGPKENKNETFTIKWTPGKAKEFYSNLDLELKSFPDFEDVFDMYSVFKANVLNSLASVGMREAKLPARNSNMKRRDKPWYTKECRDKLRHVRASLRKWKTGKQKINEYLVSKSQYFSLIRDLRNKYNEGISETISKARNSREWWEAIKKVRYRDLKFSTISLDSWENYLETTYPFTELGRRSVRWK